MTGLVWLASSTLSVAAVPQAPTSVKVSNLAYIGGAVLLAIIGVVVVALRYRKPKSVQANVDTFQRGLRALAPDEAPLGRQRAERSSGISLVEPVRRGTVQVTRTGAAPDRRKESDAG